MKRPVIFDMDGVISDTQLQHATAEQETLKSRYGLESCPLDISVRFAGCSILSLLEGIFGDHKKALPNETEQEAFKAEVRLRLAASIERDGIKEVPGASTLVADLARTGHSLGIASGSNLNFINQVVTTLELTDHFLALTSAKEVTNPKPAPDVWLLAASRLQVNPSDCIIIEDGVAGLSGAKEAGMTTIHLQRYKEHSLCPSADFTVATVAEAGQIVTELSN